MQIKKAMDSLIQTFDKSDKPKSSESKSAKESLGIATAKSIFESPLKVAGAVAESGVKAGAAAAEITANSAMAMGTGVTLGTALVAAGVSTSIAAGQAAGGTAKSEAEEVAAGVGTASSQMATLAQALAVKHEEAKETSTDSVDAKRESEVKQLTKEL